MWRAEIRAKGRKDKIRVATFRNGDRGFAMRRPNYSDDEASVEIERGWKLERLGERTHDLEHELIAWIRSDNESVTFCKRCGARIYGHTDDTVVIDDEL